MNNYQKAMLYLAAARSRKLPSLIRLALRPAISARQKFDSAYAIPMPVTVSIRLTYKCNLRCIQCGQWGQAGVLKDAAGRQIDNAELSTDQFKNFIEDIAKFGPYLLFTGGEPLLRHDAIELIKFASKNNLPTGLSTNGTLLETNAEDLVRSGLDYLFVSLDGPKSINDKVRLGEDAYERVISGIRAFKRERRKLNAPLPILQVHTTITEENHKHLLEMAELVQNDIAPDVFGISPGVFTTECLSAATADIYKEEFGIERTFWRGFIRDMSGIDAAQLESQIKAILSKKWVYKLRLYPPMGYKDFNFFDYINKPEKIFGGVSCGAFNSFTQIQPNGDVATCGSQPDYIAGNILKDKFQDIWNGEKYNKFRDFLRKGIFPACSRCWALYEFYRLKP